MATIKQIKDTNNEIHDIGVKWTNVIEKPDAFIGYGTCSTPASTSAKVVTMTDSDWHLEVGNIIGVKFSNSNLASSVTLNVNETGAKYIYYDNAKYTSSSSSICGYANRVLYYMYDGTYWVWMNMGSLDGNTNTIPSAQCETAAATAAKTAKCTNYSLLSKSYLHVNIRYSNSAQSAITLNVNSKGAKPIYINGTASSTSNYTLPAGTYIVYYDGTNYYFRTDGVIVQYPENHYTPSPDTNSELTASLSGTAGSYAKDTEYTVLTGVKAQRDSKGHITGLTYTAQKIKDTNNTYSTATSSAAGLMSAADKTKLDGAATLSGDNTFTGLNEFDNCPEFNDGISVTGDTYFSGSIVHDIGSITTPILHVAQPKSDGSVYGNGGKIVFGDYKDDVDNHEGHLTCIEEINGDELTFTARRGFMFSGGDVACDGGDFCGYLNGTSTKAEALTSTSKGSATQPVYFDANGKPVACTYTLGKSVPSNAVFTDTKYTHPTTAGYKHIPSGGSSGQILKYSSSGTAKWDNISDGDIKHNSNSQNGITTIDACHSGIYSANRLAFAKPAGIQIEYSTNSGSDWLNYNTTDSDKIKLISGIEKSYFIGGTNTGITTNYQLRVTIDANACGVYIKKLKILIKIRTNGANGCLVKLEHSMVGSEDTWIDNGNYSISGWPAWNSIPFIENLNFGYNNSSTQTSHSAKIRMTFSIGSTNSSYSNALELMGIYLIGHECYAANSQLAKTGDIYTYDANQNVSFPGTVSATSGFFETSDERLKDIVKSISVDLDQLSKLRKVYFNWKDKPESTQQLGMIAQDVQEIYPELVSETNGKLSLSYEKLSVVALEAIDILHKENTELKNRIERLEALVNQLVENK